MAELPNMTRRKAILRSGASLFVAAVRADELQLSRVASVSEFEPVAKTRLTAMAYDYLAGGVGNEVTLRANVEAWEKVRIRPRVFVDVSRIDTRVRLFGSEMPHPILLAPTAYHKLFHSAGELETVRGAAAAGSTLVASSFSTTIIEEMARAAPAKMWFQLYVQPDRGFTRALVQRAEAAGCTALCLTADFAVRGYRDSGHTECICAARGARPGQFARPWRYGEHKSAADRRHLQCGTGSQLPVAGPGLAAQQLSYSAAGERDHDA